MQGWPRQWDTQSDTQILVFWIHRAHKIKNTYAILPSCIVILTIHWSLLALYCCCMQIPSEKEVWFSSPGHRQVSAKLAAVCSTGVMPCAVMPSGQMEHAVPVTWQLIRGAAVADPRVKSPPPSPPGPPGTPLHVPPPLFLAPLPHPTPLLSSPPPCSLDLCHRNEGFPVCSPALGLVLSKCNA